MSIRLIRSGTDWEEQVGYSRAVRVGNEVFVSGTTATDESGTVVGQCDPYAQTKQALSNVDATLTEPLLTTRYSGDRHAILPPSR